MKHILDNNSFDETQSLCGERVEYDKAFYDIDHAFWDAKIEGKLNACHKCAREIMKIFKVPIEVIYKEQPRNKKV